MGHFSHFEGLVAILSIDRHHSLMFNLVDRVCGPIFSNQTIAHDKGKPVARQGRKAVSLSGDVVNAASEIVWLPKASDTVVEIQWFSLESYH